MTGYILGSNNEGGYADIFKTIDGGKTWDIMELTLREVPRNMFFLNGNIGFVTFYGSNGNLLKTTDGGINWIESNPLANLKSNYSDNIVLPSDKYLILIENSMYKLIRK